MTSTSAAEYIGAIYTALHVMWIRQVMTEINIPQDDPIPLAIDNQGASGSQILRPYEKNEVHRHMFPPYTRIGTKQEYCTTPCLYNGFSGRCTDQTTLPYQVYQAQKQNASATTREMREKPKPSTKKKCTS